MQTELDWLYWQRDCIDKRIKSLEGLERLSDEMKQFNEKEIDIAA